MPETKYTSRIYLAVRSGEPDTAGKAAARAYQEFLARLRHAAPKVRGMRLEMQKPVPRTDEQHLFHALADLKAMVPEDLEALGAENAHDAWRIILRKTLRAMCIDTPDLVHHASSFVEMTRPVHPSEEVTHAEAAPKEEKPKEMIAVKVLLGGQEFNVEVPKGENLLDGVNDKGVAVKWDCKSGVCDTCKVRVLNGMENLGAPNDNEQNMLGDQIQQGFRLCCQLTVNGSVEIQQ